MLAPNIPIAPTMTVFLCLTAQLRNLAYPSSNASNAFKIGEYNRLNNFPFLLSLLIICDASIGVSVSAARIDRIIMMLTIQPNCLNSTPAIPVTMVRGRNTARIVSVEAITERPTSFVPCIAACLGELPLSMCVVMFSSTTIASSTTIPIAMDSELSEMILSELPDAKR